MSVNIKAFIKDILKKTTVELVVLLLVTVITSIVGIVWALIDWQSFIDFFNLRIPLWEVFLIIVLLILTYIAFVLWTKNSWKNYKSDVIFGTKLSWEYDKYGNIDSFNVYCPKCGIKMNSVTNIDNPFVPLGFANYYRCPNCNTKFEYSEDLLNNTIETRIEKKKKKI